jgi:hypothetical protein
MTPGKVGLIAEGGIDEVLLQALIERIAAARAQYAWSVAPAKRITLFPMRKRGAGGVVEATERLIRALETSPFEGYLFFLIVLDSRPRNPVKKVRQLVSGRERFVFGVAIREIEAWWLGDRKSTLQWLQLSALPLNCAYAAKGYTAEKDREPKRTLDELTRLSRALLSRYRQGNAELAAEFAEQWRSKARLDGIELQCPKGFRPFCRATADAFRRVKAGSGGLF